NLLELQFFSIKCIFNTLIYYTKHEKSLIYANIKVIFEISVESNYGKCYYN
ncbi:MAG: hypothetical protein K0R09_3233, partial [Clostridiales bacterium]|nr:hypothetical protein [Clostridiales bacterium]